VPGITLSILAVGTETNKLVMMSCYGVVFFSTIAFSAIAILSALFLPNADHLLTGKVVTTLHG